MSKHPEMQHLPAIAILDGERRPSGMIVADSPERLWAAMQGALCRQRSEPEAGRTAVAVAPLDFATAMRRVEAEVYDAA